MTLGSQACGGEPASKWKGSATWGLRIDDGHFNVLVGEGNVDADLVLLLDQETKSPLSSWPYWRSPSQGPTMLPLSETLSRRPHDSRLLHRATSKPYRDACHQTER